MKDFELVAIFMYAYEYAVLKLLMDQEHIRYFFENENMAAILPLDSIALGGIRLKVHKDDVQRAKQLIEDLNSKSADLEIV
ncbi:MAG TPA: hypothetical protein VKZ42_04785 [Flavobacteriaceae bacterium]|jgi:hypothetical protein|nr:hypothetical protein [Flavobacteriaceae bacterium]